MSDTNFIDEIQEEIRRDKLKKLWNEYGAYLIGGLALLILVTGAASLWHGFNERVASSQTAALVAAIESESPPDALRQLVPGLRPNPRGIARLSAAGLLAEAGKTDEALAEYHAAAADRELQPLFRDLAQLLAVRTEWTQKKPDMNAAALLGALQTVWENDKSPWRWHARELAALITAHESGDPAAARTLLAPIFASSEAPASLMERARALDHVYALREPKKPAAETAKEEPEG